jgi:hypothetical protein
VNRALGVERELPVAVLAGQTARVEVKFEKAWLEVRASPWADVRIDGRLVGTTPLPEQELYEGRHLVELSNAETGQSRRLVVRLAAGERKTLRESMK